MAHIENSEDPIIEKISRVLEEIKAECDYGPAHENCIRDYDIVETEFRDLLELGDDLIFVFKNRQECNNSTGYEVLNIAPNPKIDWNCHTLAIQKSSVFK